jgi:hypothetical protein
MEAVETPTETLISLAQKMLTHTSQLEHVMTEVRRELLTLPEKEP